MRRDEEGGDGGGAVFSEGPANFASLSTVTVDGDILSDLPPALRLPCLLSSVLLHHLLKLHLGRRPMFARFNDPLTSVLAELLCDFF